MRKLMTLSCCICMLFLAACSSHTQKEDIEEAAESKEIENEEAKSSEQLEGKKVEEKNGSLLLPFDEIVIAAEYSEDGQIKILQTENDVVLIDGEEVVHAEQIKPFPEDSLTAIMVSDDGRFATWRGHQEDWEISVYDVKKQQLDVVKKTEEYDPYGIGDTPLIVQQDDTYYLTNNEYMFGYDVENALDLVTNEMYSFGEEADVALLQELNPEKRISDEAAYTEVENKMYQAGKERGHDSSLPAKWTDYGYFEVYYDGKETDDGEDSEEVHQLTELIGHDVEKGKLIDIPLEEEIDLNTDKAELTSRKLAIAENGHVLMPVFEQTNDENKYLLSV